MEISIAILATLGCMVFSILGAVFTIYFVKNKNENVAATGMVFSVLIAAPFFLALCYFVYCFVAKIGKTI